MRLFESAIGVGLLWFGASCGDNPRPPPAGFGNVPDGAGGRTGGGARGGTSGRAGKGGSAGTNGGESGDGPSAGGNGDGLGGEAGEGGAGNRGGANGGAGNLGAQGGGGNETAEGGALLTGPDLSCPKLEPVSGTTPPTCDPKASWGKGALVLTEPGGADVLLSISPDELSVAWLYQDALGPLLYVADRVNLGDDFGEPQRIMDQGDGDATQIALAPDRLRLVAVLGGQFIEFVRATTGNAFEYAGTGHFAAIDLDAGTQGASLADPVLSADDSAFYYSLEANVGKAGPTIYVAQRGGNGDWTVGTPLDECELDGESSQASRRPTGLSADQRTLFYYDELRVAQRAAWRPAPDRPFDTFVDLPNVTSGAQPNATCDRLYYSAITATGLQVQVAAEK